MIAILVVAVLAILIAQFLRWVIALSQGSCLQSVAAVVLALLGLAMALGVIVAGAGVGGWEGWLQP